MPAIAKMAPGTPPLIINPAANLLKMSEDGDFLDLCPMCVQITQAFLSAKAQQARTETDPEVLAAMQARSRIILPGQPGFRP